MKKLFRVAFRLPLLLGLFLFAFLDFVFCVFLAGRAGSYRARADWMRKWAIRMCRIIRMTVTHQGRPPERGVLVSNHLSYLDIIVLGSLQPLVFVSKSEVARWPVVGTLTQCAGTIYVVRQQRSDVVRTGEEMVPVVEEGVICTIFPEGTSSDGSGVLPFRSSLLASAETHRWPVTGAWIHYSLRDGSVADEVCYWRDMTFFPHLLNLLSKESVEAFVSYGTPLAGEMDRKEMARELHAQVCWLREDHLGASTPVRELAAG